jgi:hypothetical protein
MGGYNELGMMLEWGGPGIHTVFWCKSFWKALPLKRPEMK